MNPLSNNNPNDVKWLSMSEASDHTPYSAEYLSLLARKGKLASKKINGVWYTTKSALDEYMQKQMLRAQVLGNSYPTPTQKLPEVSAEQSGAPAAPAEPALDVSIYDEASLKKLKSFHADIRAYMEREGLPLPKEEEIAPARNTTDVLKLAEQDYSERTIAQEFLPSIPQKNVVADTLGAVRKETHEGIEKTLEKVLDKKLGAGSMQLGSSMASLPVLPRRSWRTVSASRMLLVATLILMVGLTTLPVPFVFSSFENAGSALKKWATDANTVMGFRPGTHKNELLLLDKDGNVAITGSIEAGGQLASYAADGVAPIVVTSKTQVNNLNAEFLNGASSTDFTLAFVTKNGAVTTEDVQLLGSVEVGKTLLVKGATKLLSSLAVDGNLAVFGNAEFNQALTVLGPAHFKQLLTAEDNLTVGKNASIRGSLTVGHSVNAGSGSFTSLGTGDFSATGQVSLGASNKTLTVDAKNVSIDKDGNASFSGLLNASTLNLTGSGTSTVAGPVVFNGSVTLQGSGTLASLSVSGSTTLADLLVTGPTSLQNVTFIDATGTNATTTNFFSSKLTALLASISSLVADDISVGALTATNSTTTNATTTTFFADTASSTNLYATNGTVNSLLFTNATGTNATTTNLFSHIGTFDDVYVNNYQQNNGTFTINSTVPTGDIFSVFDTAITDGTLIHQSLTANAGNGETSKGQIIDLVDATVAGGGYSAFTVNVTGSGVGSGSKLLLDLNPGANKEIVFDANGALRPTVDASQNITSIGTPSYYFKNGYFDTITANAISGTVITGSTASHTWTIGANETGDVNEAIIFQRNSGSGNALFQWNASNGTLNDQRFLSVNYPFNATYTINDSSIATSSSLYSGLFTNNTTSGTQRLLSLTNTGTGSTENGIYINNTGTGVTGIEVAGMWTTGIKTNNNSINAGTGALSAGFATFANILATGSTTLQNFTAVNSTTTNATTTNFFSNVASTTNLFFGIANGGTQTISGLLTAGNLLVTGSSTLQNFTFTNATGTNATTTNFYAANATLGNLNLTNLIFQNATGTNATTTNFFSTVASSTNLFSTTLAVGGDKLVVSSGGNVGIGITNPSSKLTVAGGDITVSGSTNGIVFANNQSIRDGGASGDLTLFTPTTGAAINFNTTNGNILFNPGTMSVGIGTSTPKGMLQVARDVGALPTTNVYGQLELTLTSSPVNRLSLGYSSTYDAGFIQAVANAVGFKKLLLNPSGGNVGVGTTNPNGVLEVAFSNASTGGIGTSNAIVINNTDTTANNWAGTSYATLTTGGVGAIGATIGMQTTSRSIIGVTSDLVFSTSNNAASPSEVLRIKANGNVGIGITNPVQKLEVAGSVLIQNNNNLYFKNAAGAGSSGWSINPTVGGTFQIKEESLSLSAFTITTAGNIGIGTTTPQEKLVLPNAGYLGGATNVGGTAKIIGLSAKNQVVVGQLSPVLVGNVNQNATIAAGDLALNVNSYLVGVNNTTVKHLIGYDSSGGTAVYVDADGIGTVFGGAIKANGAASSYITGNLGIGSTTPTQKLSVVGAAVIDDGSANHDQFLIKPGSGGIGYSEAYLSAQGQNIAIYGNPQGSNFAGSGGTYSAGTAGIQAVAGAPLVLGANGSEKVRITTAGNVGIGVTNPGDKLEVSGNVYANAFNAVGALTRYNSTGGVSVVGNSGSSYGEIRSYNDSSGTGRNLALNPTGGNVGIGTTNPGYKLDVNGATGLHIGNSTYDANLVFGNSGAWDSGIRTYDNNDAEMRIWHMNNGGQIILATGYNGNQSTTLPTDGLVVAGDAGVNRIGIGYTAANIRGGGGKLLVNGNVGIGVTNPISPLAVSGGTTMTGGWNRTAMLQATFPVLGFNSNNTRWGGIGYDYSVGTGIMRFYTGAGTTDVTSGSNVLSIDSTQATFSSNLAFSGSLSGNGIQILSTTDAFLRINQSNQFSNGIWLGTSDLKMHTGTIRVGSQGSAGEVEISGTAGDAVTRVKINGNAGGGIQLINGTHLDLYRSSASQNGISWYDPSYNAWVQYMSPGGQTGAGPNGALTAPSGSLVTSWALRSYVENVGGYGWTWESASNTATPSVKFEIRSSDGTIHSYGNGSFDGGTVAIGGMKLVTESDNALKLQSGNNSISGLHLEYNNGTSLGYLYGDSSGFGLLSGAGGWAMKVAAGSNYVQSYREFYPGQSGGGFQASYYLAGSTSGYGIYTNTSLGVAATLNAADTISTQGDFYANGNYGRGLVGLYDPTKYRNVYSMSPSYRLAADGSGPGNLYGIAMTYEPGYGGAGNNTEAKAGLGHQFLFMSNGTTQTAIGTGIWTNGNGVFSGYVTTAGAPTSGYNLNTGSIGASTVYGYSAICTGNASGACNSSGGVVMGVANSSAFTNFPNSGNSTVGGQLGVVGNIVQGSGAVIYPGTISGLSANQTSYYIASHASWGLYANTSFNIQGVYDVGNRVCSGATCNIGSQTISSGNITISGNSPTLMLSSGNDDSRVYFSSSSLSVRGEPGQSLSFYTNASSRSAYFDPNGFHVIAGGVFLPDIHNVAPTCSASTFGLTAMGNFNNGGNTVRDMVRCMQYPVGGGYYWAGSNFATFAFTPDLAEYVPVQDESISGGEVLALSDVPNLSGSKPYDSFYAERASAVKKEKVIGIVSTEPGYILNRPQVLTDDLSVFERGPDTSGLKPLALAGRVPVKVTTENGPVQAGDYITVSDTVPGKAMKMTTAGNAIGQALDNYDPATGTVLVLVGKTYFTNGISIEDLKNRLVAVENDVEMLKTVASSTAARIDSLETRVLALEGATSTGLTFDATTTNPIVSGMLAVLGSAIVDGVTHFKDVVVAALTVGSHENPTGITIYDTATGNPFCFKVTNGATVNVPGKCGQETSTPSVPSAPVVISNTSDTTASSTPSTTASSTPSTATASSTPATDTSSSASATTASSTPTATPSTPADTGTAAASSDTASSTASTDAPATTS